MLHLPPAGAAPGARNTLLLWTARAARRYFFARRRFTTRRCGR